MSATAKNRRESFWWMPLKSIFFREFLPLQVDKIFICFGDLIMSFFVVEVSKQFSHNSVQYYVSMKVYKIFIIKWWLLWCSVSLTLLWGLFLFFYLYNRRHLGAMFVFWLIQGCILIMVFSSKLGMSYLFSTRRWYLNQAFLQDGLNDYSYLVTKSFCFARCNWAKIHQNAQ